MKFTQKIFNFTKALTKYAASGLKNVDEDTYNQRLSICESCPLLKNNECGLCGCPVQRKALWSTEACPDGKWPAQEKPIKKTTEGFSANSGSSEVKPRKCNSCKNRK